MEGLLPAAVDGLLLLRERQGKEKIPVVADQVLFGLIRRSVELPQADFRSELVVRAAYEQFGLGAIFQKLIGVSSAFHGNRHSQPNQAFHAIVAAGCTQSRGSAEREPAENHRQMKLIVEPVERGADVFYLAFSVVMLAFT